jgi:hypothetical protein
VAKLTAAEQETHFNIVAADRKVVEVYTDDPYWVKKIKRVTDNYTVVGNGIQARLAASQLTIRKLPKPLTVEQQQQRRERGLALRRSHATNE